MSRRRKNLGCLVLGAIMFAVYLFWGAWARHGATEPRGATLREHLELMPAPVDAGEFILTGQKYLALHGPHAPLFTFPSGGPIYVFGTDGILVAWTSDSGDALEFEKRWPGAYQARGLSATDIRDWPTVRKP